MSLPRRWCLNSAISAALACFMAGCGSDPAPGPVQTTTPTLTALSLNPTSVTAGGASQGTVTLSAAPTSAASVTLSSNNAAATVPGSVAVNSGSTTASFSITTASVASATPVSITASFNGANQSATLTVNPAAPPPPPAPTLTASFRVASLSPALQKTNIQVLPAGAADACPIVGNNRAFDCMFDGSASTAAGAPIQQYIWTYFVGPRSREERSSTPQHKPTESGCTFFGDGIFPNAGPPGGLQFIGMRVDLRVVDTSGAVSAVVSNQNIRIFPNGACGYGF